MRDNRIGLNSLKVAQVIDLPVNLRLLLADLIVGIGEVLCYSPLFPFRELVLVDTPDNLESVF